MSNDPMWPDPNRTPADSETARADANAEMYANATYERVRVVYDIDIITTTDGGWQGLARVLHPSDGLRTKNATFVECLKWCDDCEQWERPRSCEHCQGSCGGMGTTSSLP